MSGNPEEIRLPRGCESAAVGALLFQLHAPLMLAAACRVMNPTNPRAAALEWRGKFEAIIDGSPQFAEEEVMPILQQYLADMWSQTENALG